MTERLPGWLTKRSFPSEDMKPMRAILNRLGLATVCENARCPNIMECYSRLTATFMILGNICTRNCRFCAVNKGVPQEPDPTEPVRVAIAAKELGLEHVVITSVTRDDLPDFGASHFALTIEEVQRSIPQATVEVLTPDFNGSKESLNQVVAAGPDIFNHNVETIPRLYRSIRPQANYGQSLYVLKRVKELAPSLFTKSGIMLGLGESLVEIKKVLKDLRDVGCEILTLGQYLRPSEDQVPVASFIPPDIFHSLKELAEKMGFLYVASSPFIRSSYRAGDFFKEKVQI